MKLFGNAFRPVAGCIAALALATTLTAGCAPHHVYYSGYHPAPVVVVHHGYGYGAPPVVVHHYGGGYGYGGGPTVVHVHHYGGYGRQRTVVVHHYH